MTSRHPRLRPAVLVIDFFHPQGYQGLGRIGAAAERAARKTQTLLDRARQRGVLTVFVNDHFGNWATSFERLVAQCKQQTGPAGRVAHLLSPPPDSAFVLKPRHSAFYGTPLEFLLAERQVNALVLTGLTADSCITVTAHDGHVRQFKLWVPGDCVAAQTDKLRAGALAHLRRVTAAITVSGARGWF
jgi:nicotinamidase-related amidase